MKFTLDEDHGNDSYAGHCLVEILDDNRDVLLAAYVAQGELAGALEELAEVALEGLLFDDAPDAPTVFGPDAKSKFDVSDEVSERCECCGRLLESALEIYHAGIEHSAPRGEPICEDCYRDCR